ncbi:MAG TPA: class I SAM-dependent methyltransferase [Thermoanaerobaculia bacterium]|nr:class I SAM-dependent methyltransferase [Thermoanaerobaculia bacterium]HQR67685.1 class I SAM-dependent methyltransferase [Thermoanaerobaculia bacterium]
MTGPPDDPFARLGYRRLVAWPERLRREEPLLRSVLERGPNRRVLDLGCGTGEHAVFLASLGFEVTGVDRSAAQLAEARRTADGRAEFVEGDLAEIGGLVPEGFGGAVCLGNTLPNLAEPERLRAFLGGVSGRLAAGAGLLIQLLNYDRIFERGIRALPATVREGPSGPVVFLRLMDPRPDGTVLFTPTTLAWRPGDEVPVEVMETRSVVLRGYRRGELEAALAAAGLAVESIHGGMEGETWNPGESPDTVVIARRAPCG